MCACRIRATRAQALSAVVERMNGQQHQRCHLASIIVRACACAWCTVRLQRLACHIRAMREHELSAIVEGMNGQQHQRCHKASIIVGACACARACGCACVLACACAYVRASMGIITEHRLLYGGYQNFMKLPAKSCEIIEYFVSCETTQMRGTTILKFSIVTPFMKSDSREWR